jgi:gamma-glutamylcyclotransferase (GGCT)/AIG2-like uncharacterized protein YtfP
MATYKIFSYGTLQRSKFVRGKTLRKATLTGPYEIMKSDYPLLQEIDRDGNTIPGIVFEVTRAEIDEIDDYEGMPHLFKRQEKKVVYEDGGSDTAWVYLLHE